MTKSQSNTTYPSKNFFRNMILFPDIVSYGYAILYGPGPIQ